MKSLFSGIAGLVLLCATLRSAWLGYIPSRGESGALYGAESPGLFWSALLIFALIGIAMVYSAWKTRNQR